MSALGYVRVKLCLEDRVVVLDHSDPLVTCTCDK